MSQKRNLFVAVAAVIASVALTACGSFGTSGKNTDYRSQGGKVASLEVSPDLTSPVVDDRFVIPDPKATTFSTYNRERGNAPANSNVVLPAVDDARIEHCGLDHVAGENVGARLGADFQLVGKALRDHQDRRIALAFQERVGCERRTHFDGQDALMGKRLPAWDLQCQANAFDCRIWIIRVDRQNFAGVEGAIWGACNEIGKRPASVDPELPFALNGSCHSVIELCALPTKSPAWDAGLQL